MQRTCTAFALYCAHVLNASIFMFFIHFLNQAKAISVSKIFTHTSGKVLEDYELCSDKFTKLLTVAIICPKEVCPRKSEHSDPKKYYIYRIFRGLDESSLAVDGTALSSYLDYRNIYNMPDRDVSTCTVSTIKNLKFLRLWIEYHRIVLWSPEITIYVLVDQKNFFDQRDWR